MAPDARFCGRLGEGFALVGIDGRTLAYDRDNHALRLGTQRSHIEVRLTKRRGVSELSWRI